MSKIVNGWLESVDLPFRYAFADCEEMTFNKVYPHFFDYLFRAVRSCIVFEGMPETFYEPFFTSCLFLGGKVGVFRRDNGDLVALNCTQADKPDLYYVPERVLFVNPTFKGECYNLRLGEECEVIYCTSQDMYRYGLDTGGLYSLIDITARLMTDNILSLNIAQKNTRLTTALAADDEITVRSIEAVLKAMYNGAPYKVVQKTLVDKLEQLPLQQTNSNQNLIDLLEVHKYILSEFYAAIGIDEPQQMKKERLVTAEVEQGAELPIFNIYDVLRSISEGLERVNEMFGTSITCKINPIIQKAFEGSAEDPESETGSEAEPESEEAQTSEAIPTLQQPEPVEDKPEQSEEDAAPEGTAGAETSEPEEEAETVTEAAAEIIETAAEIIKMQEGGAADEPENESES